MRRRDARGDSAGDGREEGSLMRSQSAHPAGGAPNFRAPGTDEMRLEGACSLSSCRESDSAISEHSNKDRDGGGQDGSRDRSGRSTSSCSSSSSRRRRSRSWEIRWMARNEESHQVIRWISCRGLQVGGDAGLDGSQLDEEEEEEDGVLAVVLAVGGGGSSSSSSSGPEQSKSAHWLCAFWEGGGESVGLPFPAFAGGGGGGGGEGREAGHFRSAVVERGARLPACIASSVADYEAAPNNGGASTVMTM
ncbi:hypothetical protein Mp_4g02670 [Marchantia polymorpha subsp. ruderalis]|uniref:Uncharacterized protein n=2 Tax=Marchantia polymorpha TaxID=3197 RepID=A0AAF6B5K9_MARPO|nr:hypothetical protein MARPO_0080s0032 [Marchantia polymorpha]BBN07293.1 hypothetical protein Mp_4g02670 [Marchantia polymorpha subsp. ruderalis]|eukprot:PTQ34411.1 hypothetical protein MARPO_0080s0032 [Marchantia polymorpha]